MAAGAAMVCSIVTLKFLPQPFVWIGLQWCVAALVVAARSRATPARLLSLVGAGTAFALAAIEAGLWILGLPSAAVSRAYTPYPMERDSVLGWRMVPGQASRALARRADSTVYDVTYTTDSLGHRIAPPDSGAGARGCVWFVVCSFTFGEGVGDVATLPYRVGIRTGGQFRIVNFGVPGYGAEHFLAALERDMRTLRPPCAPTHVVYQALQQHVLRAAGRTDFSAYGPRYRLGPDGKPVFTGTPVRPAATEDNSLRARLTWQLTKSRLFRILSDRPQTATPHDLQLYLAILRQTRERLAARYPEAALHVVGWGTPENRLDGAFQDSLAAVIPNYHRVADMIGDLGTAGTKYQILHDGHPNALAYDLLARYVAGQILGVPQP